MEPNAMSEHAKALSAIGAQKGGEAQPRVTPKSSVKTSLARLQRLGGNMRIHRKRYRCT